MGPGPESPGTAHGGEKPYPSWGVVVASATRPLHTAGTARLPLKSRLSPPPANPRFSLSCAAPSLSLTSAAESETPISGSPQRTEHPHRLSPGPIRALISVASGGRLRQISYCFACCFFAFFLVSDLPRQRVSVDLVVLAVWICADSVGILVILTVLD